MLASKKLWEGHCHIECHSEGEFTYYEPEMNWLSLCLFTQWDTHQPAFWPTLQILASLFSRFLCLGTLNFELYCATKHTIKSFMWIVSWSLFECSLIQFSIRVYLLWIWNAEMNWLCCISFVSHKELVNNYGIKIWGAAKLLCSCYYFNRANHISCLNISNTTFC